MPPLDDIPQAARDTPLSPAVPPSVGRGLRLSKTVKWVLLFVLAAVMALLAGSFAAWYQTTASPGLAIAKPFQGMIAAAGTSATEAEDPTAIRDRAVQLAPTSRTLLGHRAYDEAPEEDLVGLSGNQSIRLRTSAAAQFEAMVQAAQGENIRLVPLSGYRSQAEQEKIFFGVKAQRGQDAQTRAEVSAPPGYSEHHTGYALDIGDGNQAGTHLNPSFADTRAYQWMEANAVRYGFELSFPPDNFQGVAFEPWHWRFVGDRESLETFYSK
ncbi:MAG TPA: D-alanyl-D-alanine carboxypeptidase family protein [Leptolyngbyaceae cyanobacterium M65_K2018_010]|nr:D-alanyl-D-alanine carboxypeptidase family protein [Leptolyngbyaceae cyanobacterium M65_K2018_010]